jgi:transcriptional regulator GlxA family with amidase domain
MGERLPRHWATADEFRRRYPKVNWRPEKFITEDRRMLCSGGVYSSMDLSLYLVEKFCGHEVALQCAKALLINMPRPCQSGYAVLPLSRPHDDDKVRAAEAYLEQNYARDVSVEALARSLNMSPPQLHPPLQDRHGTPARQLSAGHACRHSQGNAGGWRAVRAGGQHGRGI